MTTIYYLLSIFFIWEEISWLLHPMKKTNDIKKFFELSQQSKGKLWDEYPDEYKSKIKEQAWMIFILIWMFIGLFTFQWAGFLAMLIFNIFIILPISKLTKYSIVYTIIHWINSLIGLGFGIFVIINHYHLKIDLTKWFLSFFQ